MAKFKVGDKVRVLPYDKKFLCTGIGEQGLKKIAGNLYTITDVRNRGVTKPWYYFAETKYVLTEEMLELSEQPRREFIVIHRSGNVMTAEHRVNREVIKSAKATCAPSDTFDFNTGAKLAFDRLMNRQNIEEAVKAWNEPAPQPAHRFKVGDRVITPFGHGKICVVDDSSEKMPYLIKYDDGYNFWRKSSKAILEPAPAPEPPKFYTGKVFCSAYKPYAAEAYEKLVGRVLSIVGGTATWNGYAGGYKSFEDFCKRNSFGTWHEVKEPSDV